MLSVASAITLATVVAHRDQVYHRLSQLRLRTPEAAAQWVDRVGFAFLFPNVEYEMPSLWHAVCGMAADMPENLRDPDLGRVWEWKDSLPAQRRIFYAKLLRAKPMLVALNHAPLFYALTENYGDPDDYLAEYEAGTLTLEAKKVYEALLTHGQAASTGVLRRLAGLDGKSSAPRFDRAIALLQRSMKIVKVGISDANRWGYSYVYDLLPRAYPDIPVQAQAIGRREAQARLLRRYIANVGAASVRQTLRLFEWDQRTLEHVLAEPDCEGIHRNRVADLDEDCLITSMLLGINRQLPIIEDQP